jgi:hypothetical protein
MAKKMTPRERSDAYSKTIFPELGSAHLRRKAAAMHWVEGWYARGRANRLTRAERAVVKAARECEQEWWSQGSLTRPRQRIADLEALDRAKGGAR